MSQRSFLISPDPSSTSSATPLRPLCFDDRAAMESLRSSGSCQDAGGPINPTWGARIGQTTRFDGDGQTYVGSDVRRRPTGSEEELLSLNVQLWAGQLGPIGLQS